MDDTNKPAPCPFCGGKAAMRYKSNHRMTSPMTGYLYGCAECSMGDQGAHDTEAQALAAWNRRSTPPAVPADTQRLDWLESDGCTHVFKIGNRWYTRAEYQMPHRRAATLRQAIDAARQHSAEKMAQVAKDDAEYKRSQAAGRERLANSVLAAPASASEPATIQQGWDVDDLLTKRASASVPGASEERDLVKEFRNAVNWCTQYHTEFQGKAMPDDVYEKFARLRDERIPRLEAELRAALSKPAGQGDGEAAVPADSEREHSPDDMRVPEPTADLKIGDYVFACRWGDGEPGDPWAVGWIEEIDLTPVTPFVTLKGMTRGWRRAMKITEEQGHRICALYPAAEELSHQERLAARAEAFGLDAARHPTSGTEGEAP